MGLCMQLQIRADFIRLIKNNFEKKIENYKAGCIKILCLFYVKIRMMGSLLVEKKKQF